MVYISNDAADALAAYLRKRLTTREQKIFLVEKGIQKRVEYYSKKSGISVSCHQLRQTIASQLLNADADLVTVQDLLGHTKIKTTIRYCRLSNMKAQPDYYKAVAKVMKKSEINAPWNMRCSFVPSRTGCSDEQEGKAHSHNRVDYTLAWEKTLISG